MEQDFLSNIELYYSNSKIENNCIIISDEEAKHILRVMRHTVGDKLFVTDGEGSIFETEIIVCEKKTVTCKIEKTILYKKEYPQILFCLPRLRNQDRFEFALEKCIELGITEFIVYEADRSVSKGEKLDRWNKIALAAMKQSLRAFNPNIKFAKRLSDLKETNQVKILFDQNAEMCLTDFVLNDLKTNKGELVFIFGPEGGLSENEFKLFEDSKNLFLTKNRLRAETAIITTASVISNLLNS
ncbi:MAG: 16S rRNA (uracil(1498)-N(3))-methyltransferase [Melioribacteraceae bacterium]|nr:16S rRNA (uracil(1498)-N(3))-methyltransferase [Melioribacteraceae bacterium]